MGAGVMRGFELLFGLDLRFRHVRAILGQRFERRGLFNPQFLKSSIRSKSGRERRRRVRRQGALRLLSGGGFLSVSRGQLFGLTHQ